MKKKIINLSIYLFAILFQFIPVFLIPIIPKSFLNIIPINIILICFDIVLIVLLFYFYRKEIKEEFNTFKSNIVNILGDNAKYYLIGFIAMVVLNIIVTMLTSKETSENQKLLDNTFEEAPFYIFTIAVLFAPFKEEFIYRKAFNNIINNKTLYCIVSGLIFGLAHIIYSFESLSDFLFVFPYAALGIGFAFIYNKTKTIFAPIFFHMFHNLVTFIMMIVVSLG